MVEAGGFGEHSLAAVYYEAIVEDQPVFVHAAHPEPRARDGTKAVHLAEKACQLTDYKAPATLDTLAAAYAELGQFDKAVKTAQKAMQLARAAKSEKLAKDIQNRLDLYKAKRPFRTSAR